MKFKELNSLDRLHFREAYQNKEITRKETQEYLSSHFEINIRTVRKWAKRLQLGLRDTIDPAKILVYDIETSRLTAKMWWTGKQYVGHNQIVQEPKIISIAWKWLGTDDVEFLTWDKNHCDKKMMQKFLKVYNEADLIVGQNNDRFDNRWINARAMKHDLDVNVYVKSFDIMKQTKRLFRLPSYSMGYITKYLGVTLKQSHEGIHMWDMIEDGNLSQQKEYLDKMIEYNIGDIISTEEMYLKLRKYTGHIIHIGVFNGTSKYSCPNCGGSDIKLLKTTTTQAGTIQRIMKCNECDVQFKMSNATFLKQNLK